MAKLWDVFNHMFSSEVLCGSLASMGLQATLTTRIITCLVGNPSKPSFATATGQGGKGERPNGFHKPSGCYISVFFAINFHRRNISTPPSWTNFYETKTTKITQRALEH